MTSLQQFDMDAFRAIHLGLHSAFLDPFFWVLSMSGLGQVQFLLSLLFLKGRETKYYVLPLLVTILVSGLLGAQLFKQFFERDRPSNLAISVPQEAWLANSYPSGHTTTSFAVATMLLLMTWGSRYRWIGRSAFGWALLVGISRVYRGVHWPTDVLGGACMGVFCACLVYLVLRKLGHVLHLDHPSDTISGQEIGRG
ncbi:phosphatase PAP2 family protein [Fimbriimonas ginsengisoli]|uniref:Phosphoesterase, PA-phosphatase n=1 Tax=Fimbriimonas ginsengisoli Gsoil 348 TaxID=661478 RepID=A0A068NUZ9_FIMGI|nr:phosphatase PAP2 family protein [Fimbriimonas ginsengisoli]AIE86560.1 phosphoesterase, PA-phosphatase [Fimbriimonas ginsengisoli Gsoil 348]